MGIFIPGKRANNRRFSYEPRYYNPQKDENVKRRLRIMTRSRRRRGPAAGAIYLAALLILALYIYSLL